MTDIAALGLSVDSRPVSSATRELDALTNAAKRTEQSTSKMASSTRAASQGAKEMAGQTGLARHEMINLSRQVQDVGVSLVSGQSPFMVLAQQGTQVYDIFSNTRGTMRGFGQQMFGLITPTRLLGLGVGALAIGAYAAFSSWKSFGLELDDTARIANATTSAMAKLQASMSFKGIGFSDSADAIGKFAANVYQARNNMGGLADVLRANGIPASKDFETNLGHVADLIQRAKGDTQLQFSIMQQAGIPATMQWVRYLEQGSSGIKAAKDAASEFGGAANDNMVAKAREFDEAWDRTTTNFGLRWRSVFISVSSSLASLGRSMASLYAGSDFELAKGGIKSGAGERLTQSGADAFYNAISREGKPRDPNADRNAISLEQQRLGLLGQTATIEEQIRATELSIQQARLAGVNISAADQARIISGQKNQLEGARLLERAELGLFDAAKSRAQVEGDLQSLIAKGTITVEERANALVVYERRMRETQERAAIAGAQFQGLKRLELDSGNLQKQLDEFGTSTLGNLSSTLVGIANGSVKAGEGFRNFGLSVVSALTEMIIKMTIIAPLARMLQGTLGGGLFGGLSGGGQAFAPGALYANGGVFSSANDNIQRFASGGAFTNGVYSSPTLFRFANGGVPSLGVMGEAGPEAVMPLTRGSDGKLGVRSQGGGGSNVTINQNMTFTNADPATKAQIIAYVDRSNARTERNIKIALAKNQFGYAS